MENWYKHSEGKTVKELKFGEFEIKYVKKEKKEDFQPRGDKAPIDISKEQLKVLKNGVKIKVRKANKLAIIEALKNDELDKVDEIVKALGTQ
ncbi:MAG: hypothetical protein M1433_00500 [Candidatus Parvarchaeota archaeon]|nr:hypothetical protein [Candidatus Parvarchaeota archaeon]